MKLYNQICTAPKCRCATDDGMTRSPTPPGIAGRARVMIEVAAILVTILFPPSMAGPTTVNNITNYYYNVEAPDHPEAKREPAVPPPRRDEAVPTRVEGGLGADASLRDCSPATSSAVLGRADCSGETRSLSLETQADLTAARTTEIA